MNEKPQKQPEITNSTSEKPEFLKTPSNKPNKPKITSKITEDAKPHDAMELALKMESIPSMLHIKAKGTETKVKSLKPNPNKYSFGKIAYNNGILEAYLYLNQKRLNRVLLNFTPSVFSKTTQFSHDLRKLRELDCLEKKLRYFLALTVEKRRKYLQKHSQNANISIREG